MKPIIILELIISSGAFVYSAWILPVNSTIM